MNDIINQKKLTDENKKKIFQGFAVQAIKSTGMDGLDEEPISFEICDQSGFVGAIVVQLFWEQLHIKYLFVEEKYRGQGMATRLMNHALEFGKLRGCHFAFVETMSFQAHEFYQKMGFSIEFSRSGYAKNTTFHYLKKILDNSNSVMASKQITRIGVYGVALDNGKMLVVRQQRGPFAGKFDFPGGGVEFGESAEQALRREFIEEVAMEFDSLQLIDNLTATIDVPGTSSSEPYSFYQIGMIYQVDCCKLLSNQESGELDHLWIDLKGLSEDKCTPLLWKYRMTQ
jgi:ribosomal protein S18 acetylase RimI-like enzyme/8-oxo-dGTP pyrophosphatase MutT (NUDIX family)